MLLRMTSELRATFSPTQIAAIEDALVPHTHVIDIRLLLPLLGKGAYLVLAAGPNRRTISRKSAQSLSNQIPNQISNPTSNQTPETTGNVLGDMILPGESFQKSPNAYRMLQRIPREIGASFSPTQIQAIENALIPRTHLVDVRLSLPFLGKGAYLVFAAGPNKRAHYRDLQNRNPFVMPAIGASVAVGTAVIASLVYLKGSTLLAEPDPVFADDAFHPTVVPFKKNRQECVKSNRQWVDNECIDKIHDPTF